MNLIQSDPIRCGAGPGPSIVGSKSPGFQFRIKMAPEQFVPPRVGPEDYKFEIDMYGLATH